MNNGIIRLNPQTLSLSNTHPHLFTGIYFRVKITLVHTSCEQILLQDTGTIYDTPCALSAWRLGQVWLKVTTTHGDRPAAHMLDHNKRSLPSSLPHSSSTSRHYPLLTPSPPHLQHNPASPPAVCLPPCLSHNVIIPFMASTFLSTSNNIYKHVLIAMTPV